ncbi:hypothetical protein HCK00_03075 [Streptomyces sp. PLAI1-29]|uniref:DUF1023 domain-containing protein n=1 Tax=Streptomyces zingiberis TaxID=2053010 RepID=A0ABX1BPB5_9ACTN|nr:hypothetical protein [Streptomyces zingiberis]
MVLVLLATTGWTALRTQHPRPGPRAAAEAAWNRDTAGGRRLPRADAAPEEIRAFFGTLAAEQRRRLADRHPLVVGNLGGAPPSLRYQANRAALRRALVSERARLHDSRLTPLGREQTARRAQRYASLLRPGRQILAFDPTGPGRVAEVFGDLTAARRVSVVVPGVDTEVVTFERSRGPYSAPVGMARALHSAERAAAPGVRTAVIAWADYTAPAGIGMDAAAGRLAARGALGLTALVRALPGTAKVALFCHSYGSVVCGVAARSLPPRVTDIAVAGSPGMRAERVSDLGGHARVWATRDTGDWIEDVPNLELGALGHGVDPVSPGFGARRLSAEGAFGHAGYFVPGTASLENFARVGVGDLAAVRCSGGAHCGTADQGGHER